MYTQVIKFMLKLITLHTNIIINFILILIRLPKKIQINGIHRSACVCGIVDHSLWGVIGWPEYVFRTSGCCCIRKRAIIETDIETQKLGIAVFLFLAKKFAFLLLYKLLVPIQLSVIFFGDIALTLHQSSEAEPHNENPFQHWNTGNKIAG